MGARRRRRRQPRRGGRAGGARDGGLVRALKRAAGARRRRGSADGQAPQGPRAGAPAPLPARRAGRGRSPEPHLDEFWTRHPVDPEVREFAEALVRGTKLHEAKIDELISQYAENWELERMAVVDRNILRQGIFELLWGTGVPPEGRHQRGPRGGQEVQHPGVEPLHQRDPRPHPQRAASGSLAEACHPLRGPLRRPRQPGSAHRRAGRRGLRGRPRDAVPGRPGRLRRRSRSPAWSAGRARERRWWRATTSTARWACSISAGSTPARARPPSGRATPRRGPPGLPRPRCRSSAPSRRRPWSTRARAIPRSGTISCRRRTGSQVFGDFATRLCFVGHSHLPGRVVAGLERAGARAGRLDAPSRAGASRRRAALHHQRRQRGPAARPRSARRLRAVGPGRANRDDPARRRTTTRRRPRKILARRAAARAGRSARQWGVSPAAHPRARAASLVVLALSGVLGALAFPTTDWSLLAWVWLVPALVSGLDARAARRSRGRLARRHRVLRRAPALARSHLPALQRDPVAGHVAADRRARRVLRPVPGRGGGRGRVARAAGSAPGARSPSRPRSGWRGSGCAGTSWAASRGACSATPSTRRCR